MRKTECSEEVPTMFSSAFAHLAKCGSTSRFRAAADPVLDRHNEEDDGPFTSLSALRNRSAKTTRQTLAAHRNRAEEG